MAWLAQEGDVFVLPGEPDWEFLSYAGDLIGVDAASWGVVVAGRMEPDREVQGLTSRELSSEYLLKATSEALEKHRIDEVVPMWPDVSVARFASRLGLADRLPGHGFLEQAGGVLTISKAAFRAVARGVGVPVLEGAIGTSPANASAAAHELLLRHHAVIVKHEWMSGGRGNEILSTVEGVHPIGARRVVPIRGYSDLERYFSERWDWLSTGGRARPVIEQYVPESSAYLMEFDITDEGIQKKGDGELLSAPLYSGQILPLPKLEAEVEEEIEHGARALCTALHGIGYRGVLGPDAIVTPDREVFFTEWNGRITGTTHVYGGIGRAAVGASYGRDRMILDRVWPSGAYVSSFADARRRVASAGLEYDRGRREGVIFTSAFNGRNAVNYCVVAPSSDRAWQVDQQLRRVFGAEHGPE